MVGKRFTMCGCPCAICRFVFCRQRQDERLRRGGEQKSVVVLSMYPYSSVLGRLCQYAGPLFFNHGHDALVEVPGCVLGSGFRVYMKCFGVNKPPFFLLRLCCGTFACFL